MAKQHKVGTMNIDEQQKTFAGFVSMSIKISATAIGVLFFLAIVNS